MLHEKAIALTVTYPATMLRASFWSFPNKIFKRGPMVMPRGPAVFRFIMFPIATSASLVPTSTAPQLLFARKSDE